MLKWLILYCFYLHSLLDDFQDPDQYRQQLIQEMLAQNQLSAGRVKEFAVRGIKLFLFMLNHSLTDT